MCRALINKAEIKINSPLHHLIKLIQQNIHHTSNQNKKKENKKSKIKYPPKINLQKIKPMYTKWWGYREDLQSGEGDEEEVVP